MKMAPPLLSGDVQYTILSNPIFVPLYTFVELRKLAQLANFSMVWHHWMCFFCKKGTWGITSVSFIEELKACTLSGKSTEDNW